MEVLGLIMRNKIFIICVLFFSSSVVHAQLTTSGDAKNPFVKLREKFLIQYAEKLEKIAVECDKLGLSEEARVTRGWLAKHEHDKLRVAILPRKVGESIPGDEAWAKQFMKLRKEAGMYLFEQSRKAVNAGHASLGFDLLMDSLREDPDHTAARKIVGFQEYQGEWCSAFDIQQLKNKNVKHPVYGWIPENQVKNYEAGKRLLNGKLVTVREDEIAHQSILQGWVIETAHYRIMTNHSLEEGVKLGDELEKLYRVWKQLFLRYFATDKQVKDLFDGKTGAATPAQKHKVYFFKSREEYNAALRQKNPGIEMSVGLYHEGDKAAYFFAGPDYDPRTVFHEATHQLFAEVRKTILGVGDRGNYWVLEGIAMYMETLVEEDGFYVLGGFSDTRMISARHRYVSNYYYVQMELLCRMTTEQFQRNPNIHKLYAQSAGLVHFLVYANDGEYRDALVEYLVRVYTGKATPTTLPTLLKKTYAELDAEYEAFITRDKEELNRWVIQE